MHFPEKFYRLPLNFDHKKLLEEINAVDESHWSPHPQAFKGNDALILLSSGGTINDLNYGPMQFTPCMEQLPYLKQVLQSFNTVIGRTRLMRLAPGEKVGRHSDVSLYWWHRFRIHVPIVTDPEVKFYCEDTHVHMQAGEAWTFDNWRYHEVHNNSNITRVHLVIDTVGSPEIWQMLENQSWNPAPGETLTPSNFKSTFIPFEENKNASFPTEQHNIVGVLSPAELDAIAEFLSQDVDESTLSNEQIISVRTHLQYIKRAWRAFYSAHGRDESYYQDYANILNNVFKSLNNIEPKPTLKSNGFLVANVLKTQVSLTIQDVIKKQNESGFIKKFNKIFPEIINAKQLVLPAEQITQPPCPIFIVSAPGAGGALVEGLLANSRSIHVLNTQTKQEINQLFEKNYTAEQSDDGCYTNLTNKLKPFFSANLTNASIKLVYFDDYLALRIPSFLNEFPNAKFIYVYSEPLQNIASLIKDWKNENHINSFASHKTGLNWHHPLPSYWQAHTLNSLEDKLIFQYTAINKTIMKALTGLPKNSLFCLDTHAFTNSSYPIVETLCHFCGIPFGPNMQKIAVQNIKTTDLSPLQDHHVPEAQLSAFYQQIKEWAKHRKP